MPRATKPLFEQTVYHTQNNSEKSYNIENILKLTLILSHF